MLQTDNPFIRLYHTARERLAEAGESRSVGLTADLRLIIDDGQDRRRFNLPTADEVAMVVPNGGKQPRPIRLSLRADVDTLWEIINSCHPAYAPLHYVLLFPHSDLGWTYSLELQNTDQSRRNTSLTQSHYYRYRLYIREHDFNIIQRAYRLFQQYLVDAYAIIDQARLA
jgi:hypothetical protein